MDGEVLFVVGLNAKTNGRSCHNHRICGQQIKSGDVLCFHVVSTVIKGKKGRGIAAVLVKGDAESCRVGFLNTSLLDRADELEGKHARVLQVLSDDKNKTPIDSDRSVYYGNKGGCKVKVFIVDKDSADQEDKDNNEPDAKKMKLEMSKTSN